MKNLTLINYEKKFRNVMDSCSHAWSKISPNWPLQNIIACNPLQGFEDMQFEEAIKEGFRFFCQEKIPQELEIINVISIKWCQVFFDQGQATIKMPNRGQGLYKSWKELAIFDDKIHGGKQKNIQIIQSLPESSEGAILKILSKSEFDQKSQEEFLTLILTSLSGWSSYIKYLGEWSYQKDSQIQMDYLAMRLIITSIIWPKAFEELLELTKKSSIQGGYKEAIKEIVTNENDHQKFLLEEVCNNQKSLKISHKKAEAQLVFCIDVRSEPMRRSLESLGNYETFGFAGFFGIPTTITNDLTKDSYASCPVLLSPKHNVIQKTKCSKSEEKKQIKGYSTLLEIKKFYQSLKYNFTTPLPLAEGMGIWSGGWMLIKTFSPKTRKFLQKKLCRTLKQKDNYDPEIESIPFEDQCGYASGALRAIGLTSNFSDMVLFCGHGSQTENNSYATTLDCGACGGRHGDSNAKILAKILNQKSVREKLEKDGIKIPNSTKFIAAKHNTTTDEVEIYFENDGENYEIAKLKEDIIKAKEMNNFKRAKQMGFEGKADELQEFFFNRSHSWSETQPEWGLARNASFIVAPRALTKNIDCGGRSFLHSYNWQIDEDNSILNLILNAPMVVAQWINSQYLFSTINNVAFGAGSKITQNIVGKIGVMQGNCSDLMHGLALQSVYLNYEEKYHKEARLITLVYAPPNKIDEVILKSPKLQQLFAKGWVLLLCLDPVSGKIYQLNRELSWYVVG